ncbi:MAG: tagaturonate reductase [Bacteroidales bacterium]|nr:tagaturonate reductase [Bacteroidales bacterium]
MNGFGKDCVVVRPVRVIQFGEGNFLRSFADWIISEMNKRTEFDGNVAVIQPLKYGNADLLNRQNGQYHLILKGIENGLPVRKIERIDCIDRTIDPYADFDAYMRLAEVPELRFVVSNTTEAGIAFDSGNLFSDMPAESFPGKLTQFLYHRFQFFKGATERGLIFLPCELIDRNGDMLKKTILQYVRLWNLGDAFEQWIGSSNVFSNTLVDRIVPGFPRDTVQEIRKEIDYDDALISESEIFHLWVIEGDPVVKREFPADKAGLNVLFVPDMKPYRDRKVTLLNGTHTVLSPVAFLYGLDTVREAVEDPLIGKFVRKVMRDELMPSLNLPAEELELFATDVLDRFRNPFIKHQLTSIMLNSFSKFKTRDLPALKKYAERNGRVPEGLVLGLAAICVYYKGGKWGENLIEPKDDEAILSFLQRVWKERCFYNIAETILGSVSLWGGDLNEIKGLTEILSDKLAVIAEYGIKKAVCNFLGE